MRWSGESLSRLDTGAALLKSRAAGWSFANEAVSFDGLLKAGWIEADGFCGVERLEGVKREEGNGVRGNWGVGGEGREVGTFLPMFFMSCCNSASLAIFA